MRIVTITVKDFDGWVAALDYRERSLRQLKFNTSPGLETSHLVAEADRLADGIKSLTALCDEGRMFLIQVVPEGDTMSAEDKATAFAETMVAEGVTPDFDPPSSDDTLNGDDIDELILAVQNTYYTVAQILGRFLNLPDADLTPEIERDIQGVHNRIKRLSVLESRLVSIRHRGGTLAVTPF